ncbi:hypothetical protein [Nostoc sp. S13]|uniref:hypothetical protein n=1 Tax=Nostoc sp. S13 TaxID=3019266 RepID=UPI00262F0F17|nr:hypothetical protein [Nostoc sp. S13]MDF5740351.1 hypothetical protein [Nostoc sp. S13]
MLLVFAGNKWCDRFFANCSFAQITPDSTLPNNSPIIKQNNITIAFSRIKSGQKIKAMSSLRDAARMANFANAKA